MVEDERDRVELALFRSELMRLVCPRGPLPLWEIETGPSRSARVPAEMDRLPDPARKRAFTREDASFVCRSVSSETDREKTQAKVGV